MTTQGEVLEFLRGWFDGLGGVSYVHHDSATETTVEATLDLADLATQILAEMAKVRAFERERCAALVDPKLPLQPSDHEWLDLERAASAIRGT